MHAPAKIINSMVLLTSYGFEFFGLLRHLNNISDGQGVFFSAFVLLSEQFIVTLFDMLAYVDVLSAESAEAPRAFSGGLLVARLRQDSLNTIKFALDVCDFCF